MSQTEQAAYRKCLKKILFDDATLKGFLTGGMFFNQAPRGFGWDDVRTADSGPYMVIVLVSMPDTLGNGKIRVFVEPTYRITLYSTNDSAETEQTLDTAMRYLDRVLESVRFTVPDATDPFEIRGFTRQTLTQLPWHDDGGIRGLEFQAEYQSFGYYTNRCSLSGGNV